MGKDKLRKFAENLTFENLVQPEFDEVFHRDHVLKGRWGADFFGAAGVTRETASRNPAEHDVAERETTVPGTARETRKKSRDKAAKDGTKRSGNPDAPIVLELGCGKGEYTVGLGAAHPDRNFIGIDIKGARMWRGAKTALGLGLANVGFLRTRIEFINSFFAPGEVSEIWITFPDPQLKKGREKKRLTSPVFLAYYAKFLAPDGVIHLKTDSRELHDYTLRVIEANGLPCEVASTDIYGMGVGVGAGASASADGAGADIGAGTGASVDACTSAGASVGASAGVGVAGNTDGTNPEKVVDRQQLSVDATGNTTGGGDTVRASDNHAKSAANANADVYAEGVAKSAADAEVEIEIEIETNSCADSDATGISGHGAGSAADADPTLSIKTTYERRFLNEGKPITYLRFGLGGRREFEMVLDD